MFDMIELLTPISLSALIGIGGALGTIWLSRKAGLGDISEAVGRESDRLIMTQSERIKLLEKRVAELEAQLCQALEREKALQERVDDLEKVIAREFTKRALKG